MNETTLNQRKADMQDKYNTLQKQASELQAEMLRLEGEFRLVNQLIEELGNAANSAQPEPISQSDKRTGK